MSFNKFTFFSSLIATGCLTGYLPIFERNENVDFIFNGLTRGWRSVVTGYKIINNYTNEGINEESHKFAAKNLYNMFKSNGGSFYKFSEILCSLDQLLPDVFIKELKPLTYENHTKDFDEVYEFMDKEFRRCLNRPAFLIFRKIDEEPLSSSSMAQIHRAYLRDGTPVAVKVHHKDIYQQYLVDITIVTIGCYLAEWFFPDFKYQWIANELKTNLPYEMIYNEEGKNAEKIRNLFKEDKRIPRIYWEFSTPTILVSKFEKGIPITDLNCLKKNRIRIKDVSRILSDIVNTQIFKYGFIPSEINLKNIYVRYDLDFYGVKHLKLIMVDHSIYREVDNEFKFNYINFWRGIYLKDKDVLKSSCHHLGINNYELFKYLLTSKKYNDLINISDQYILNKDDPNNRKNSENTVLLKIFIDLYKDEIYQNIINTNKDIVYALRINQFLKNFNEIIGYPFISVESTIEQIYTELLNLKHPKITKFNKILFYKEYFHLKFTIMMFKFSKNLKYIFTLFWPFNRSELTSDDLLDFNKKARYFL